MTRDEAHWKLVDLISKGKYEEACLFRDSVEDAGITLPKLGWDDIKDSHQVFAMILAGEEPDPELLQTMLLYGLARTSKIPSMN